MTLKEKASRLTEEMKTADQQYQKAYDACFEAMFGTSSKSPEVALDELQKAGAVQFAALKAVLEKLA